MPAHVASPRLKRIQTLTLVLLVAGGMLNYIDRATLAVANPLVSKDLSLDPAGMGWLLSAFLWAYAIGQLPGGILVDRLGARIALTLSMAVWSLGQLVGGVVTSFTQFFAARVALGLGEAPNFPGCARASRDWFHRSQRGTAVGIWNSSSAVGSAISLPLLTLLMQSYGWRVMFIIMGCAGLLLAAVIYRLVRNPPEVDLTPQERAYLAEGDDPNARSAVSLRSWGQLFSYRTTWGMMIGYFGCIYGMWLFNTWLPGYLQQERHFTIGKTGLIGAIPFVFGAIGALSGGWIVDVLLKRGYDPIRSRKLPMASALLMSATLEVVAAVSPSDVLALACISGAMFLIYVSSSAAWAMASVAVPQHLTASIGAVQNFGGFIGGALAPIVTGYTVKYTHSFASALIICAAVAIVAAIGHWMLIRQPIPAESDAAEGGLATPVLQTRGARATAPERISEAGS